MTAPAVRPANLTLCAARDETAAGRRSTGPKEAQVEFLLVNFREERDVLIDGEVAGLANQLIALAPGTVTVSLIAPLDFSPAEHTVTLRRTSPLAPFEVDFA